ncbi:protein SLENDER RICE1-LIKE 2-like [Lolium perenne]|uniref:protein SLENDER RICE1-LIKE 2-like n=1 Tax=Lolium perenne TaxID=4522 RepID=UPI0021F611DE|nr:protein SLENDER RICE1-LIKE 2-like [Lolium perenne]
MDPAAGKLPLPSAPGAATTTNGAGASMCTAIVPAVPLPPTFAEAEAARKRQEQAENNAIRLVHLLVTCAKAIQAGDYAVAFRNLSEAHTALTTKVTAASGIGRVVSHFALALAHRLVPASPTLPGGVLDAASSAAHAGELYRQFYDAGPYLKFAHYMANQAILRAFDGCDRVHIIDLAIMQGVQWPALIETLSLRPGGPPAIRLTGVGPPPAEDGSCNELHEVGLRLAEFARACNVPFSFRAVTGHALDSLQPWMFQIIPGEALAVNSIYQLHRLLVDPDAASTSRPSPIDAVLGWVAAMQPRVFAVVEQEADHNKSSLVERFTNALFYYAAVIDSMEARSPHHRSLGAEAYLQREIFDIVCSEGSGRVERHEPLNLWRARLLRAGFAQLPVGPRETWQALTLLREYSGARFGVMASAGCLTLMWHDQPLFTASVWSGAPTNTVAAGMLLEPADINKSSSDHQQVAAGGIAMQ